MKMFSKNNKENTNNIEELEDKEMKKGFFKKVWYSIDKVEKYSELSAEGFGRAIKYLVLLVLIIAMIASASTVYRTSLEIKSIGKYINEYAPELTYKEGVLQVDSEDVIRNENTAFGKMIVDTKTESEEQINLYINEINEEENAIIILKDKLIIKEGTQGTTEYNYEQLLEEIGISEFNKQQIVEYLTGSSMTTVYFNLFSALIVYAFVIYFVNTLLYIIPISIVGYTATLILRLKIRYIAIFNMAVYAITLSTILNMIYIIINSFFNYTIRYFDIMYILIASIYMIAAIFILKIEFNKKQGEVQKIVEVEKQVKEELEEQRKEEKQKENKKKNKDTGKKDKEKEETNGEEPEGSNA